MGLSSSSPITPPIQLCLSVTQNTFIKNSSSSNLTFISLDLILIISSFLKKDLFSWLVCDTAFLKKFATILKNRSHFSWKKKKKALSPYNHSRAPSLLSFISDSSFCRVPGGPLPCLLPLQPDFSYWKPSSILQWPSENGNYIILLLSRLKPFQATIPLSIQQSGFASLFKLIVYFSSYMSLWLQVSEHTTLIMFPCPCPFCLKESLSTKQILIPLRPNSTVSASLGHHPGRDKSACFVPPWSLCVPLIAATTEDNKDFFVRLSLYSSASLHIYLVKNYKYLENELPCCFSVNIDYPNH